ATKKILGLDPDKDFQVAPEVLKHTRTAVERGTQAQLEWNKQFESWAVANPQAAQLFDRLASRQLPAGWDVGLPTYSAADKPVATRAASGDVLSALAPRL